MKKIITLLRGDGIGPEIVREAVRVLDAVAAKYNHTFLYHDVDIGGCAIDKYGVPITDEGMNTAKNSDAVLLGAVGGPKWDGVPRDIRPERALLAVRKALGLFSNLRPTKLYPELVSASPLRPETVNGIDLIIVRELTGGIYFGAHNTADENGVLYATDEMKYSVPEIERIGKTAFETAMLRRKKVVSVDKANVLDTSRLWRSVMHRIAEAYPEVEYSDLLVDNAAMQLVRNPRQFDVIVTENMFGDILSDEASMLSGSIGMMPSASLSESTLGMYEPIHGSAPDIAGQNIANPLGTVLSAAMLLRYSFGMCMEADCVERAVENALAAGCRTADIAGKGEPFLSCSGMGDEIVGRING